MQRVVRSTLVGLLTVAGLTACGDKITVPPQTTIPVSTVVREVTVSPQNVSIPVGATAQLSASVNADAGVTDRTVTWTTSSATIATVDANGLVTGKAAGVATITAASKADPNVKAGSAVTVTAAGGSAIPTVIITGINQNPTNTPVNVNAAAGQLDVLLDVNTNGAQLRSVSATLACPGGTTMTRSQTIAGAASDVDGAAVPVVLSFPTQTFDATTGKPALLNGACTLTATATTGTSTTQSATTTQQITLANADGVVLTTAFAGYTNAEGVATLTSANDAGGLPWRGGAVTLSVVPVLYTGRTLSSVSITLPGANTATQTLTAAPYSATWSATSTSAPNVTGLTLVGAGVEANGTTPKGITPTVVVLDNNGNDLNIGTPLNAGVVGQTTFRLDNTAPQPPTTFIISPRQAGWVNASYVFTGQGAGRGLTPPLGFAEYVSCGDGPANTSGAGYACTGTAGQIGVSAGAVGNNGGTNGLTTFTYYAIPAASYSPSSAANGTSTSATSCSTSGWTKITNGGDLAATLANTAYVVRVFESDLLKNARCVDLAAAPNTINTGTFARGTFGVDKVAPTAVYIEPAADPTAAANNGALAVGGAIANFNIKIGLSDDASGFSGLPITTLVQRLAVNPATGAAASPNSAFGCPSGVSNSTCVSTSTANTIRGDANGITDANGTVYAASADASGCVGCGYFFYTQTALDLARNATATMTRNVVIDLQAPTVGGIQVPAALTGGASASFATSAIDNLDLISSDYSLTYNTLPSGAAGPFLVIRAAGPALGVAFDNVLTTSSSFAATVPLFIRSIATTTAGNAPQNNGNQVPGPGAGLPTQIGVRVYDAANNPSVVSNAAINAANVPQTTPTNYLAAPAGANPAATMISFQVSNAAANISNCPTATCAGGVAPANATSVALTATSTGNEGATYQFINPFTQVQFYYYDSGYAGASNEWILIGSAVAPVVTDNNPPTIRTFTWTLSPAFDPPAALGSGATLKVIAIGLNAVGDGLASAVYANIPLTNP